MYHKIYQYRSKLVTATLAIVVTSTAITMAAVAAWARGGTMTERVLLMALSVSICFCTYLIPALSKKWFAWILWFGCLLCAIYSHLSFLTHATLHAGESRAQSSGLVIGLKQQIEARRNALVEIKARPITEVEHELANASDYRLRSALRSELVESRRAVALRDDLVRLSSTVTTAEIAVTNDPVAALLATVTGSNGATVDLIVWTGISLLIELLGALLWCDVLKDAETVLPASINTTIESGSLSFLRDAIASGECQPTVSGIRGFMKCGQAQAMMLRRAL